jgi:hypothetical protein
MVNNIFFSIMIYKVELSVSFLRLILFSLLKGNK